MSIKDDFNYMLINSKFPRLGLGLELRWGTSEFEPYILDLLNDTKEHTRQGFSFEICSALNSILMTHHQLFPSKRIKSNDIWNSTFGEL